MSPNHRHYNRKSYSAYSWLHGSTFILRLALTAPAIYYWGYAQNHHKVISHNELLHNGTYNPAISRGERLADQWSTVTFIWTISVWGLSLLLPPPVHLPIVVGDTIITGYVSRCTAYQSGYAPEGKKACHNMTVFYNERPPGTNESFFAAAARLNETVTTPTKMCESFVKEWQYGVTLSVIYALLSLIGIVCFFGCIRIFKERSILVYQIMKIAVIGSSTGFIYLLFFLFYTPVYLFRGCLPIKTKAPVRTTRRCAVKTALGARQNTELALKELKTGLFDKKSMIKGFQDAQREHTPLAQFLGIYDMLMMVVPHLHYTDVMNLACVSKSIRDSVLPADDFYRRLVVFKSLTCMDDCKAPCWVCSIQTCPLCYQLASVTQTTAIHHLENCVPYCIPCYYDYVALAQPFQRGGVLKSARCKCAPAPAHPPTFYERYAKLRSSRYEPRGHRAEERPRPVCSACIKSLPEQLTSRKDESAKDMLKRGQKSSGQKWEACAREGCEKRLSAGPRFWICSNLNCRSECTSRLHQAWGGGSKWAEDTV